MTSKDIELLQYECTLMPLTPIQIGDGKDLSPFDYILKNKEFYRIEISEVLEKMPENIRNEFIKTLEERSMVSARKFLKNNYKKEYGYLYKCSVDDEFSRLYEQKIGGTNKPNEENQLIVGEFIGTHRGKYIPGSTIKGALRTAYLSGNFDIEKDFYKLKRETENRYGKKLETKPFKSILNEKTLIKNIESRILELTTLEPKFDPFKNFKVTDTEIRNDITEIRNILRKGIKKDKLSMPMGSFEVTKSLFGSNENIKLQFQINIKNLSRDAKKIYIASSKQKNGEILVKDTIDFYLDDGSEILSSLNEKAEKMIQEDIKFFKKIKDNNSLNFCEELLKYKQNLKENQALIRIGRGAGFNSTTFNLFNQKTEEVFTRVTVDDMPIGWALITCNII